MLELGAGAWGWRGQAQILGRVCVWEGGGSLHSRSSPEGPFGRSGPMRSKERIKVGASSCSGAAVASPPSPCAPTGMWPSASPFLTAWLPWPWWTPGMRCQVTLSSSATGLGTRGLWGSPMWNSMMTRSADVCRLLDEPATCQPTCVLRKAAWTTSLRDTPGFFLQLPSPFLLALHGPAPRRDCVTLLRWVHCSTCPYSLSIPPLCHFVRLDHHEL